VDESPPLASEAYDSFKGLEDTDLIIRTHHRDNECGVINQFIKGDQVDHSV
jgi:hypothetical protein